MVVVRRRFLSLAQPRIITDISHPFFASLGCPDLRSWSGSRQGGQSTLVLSTRPIPPSEPPLSLFQALWDTRNKVSHYEYVVILAIVFGESDKLSRKPVQLLT